MMNTALRGKPSAGMSGFDRREFLKGTAWMGLAAAAAGCQLDKVNFGGGAPMAGFVAPRLKRIRVGLVGTGSRGTYAFKRLPLFANVEVTERSQARRGAPEEIPDFTRGAWKTMKPLGIETVDMAKIGLTGIGDAGPQQTIGQSKEG